MADSLGEYRMILADCRHSRAVFLSELPLFAMALMNQTSRMCADVISPRVRLSRSHNEAEDELSQPFFFLMSYRS